MNLDNIEKQDLRHAVIYAFASRAGVSLTPAAVMPSLRRLLPFADRLTTNDVDVACQFHVDLGNLKKITDEWGGEDSYEITAKGTLAYERDRNKIA